MTNTVKVASDATDPAYVMMTDALLLGQAYARLNPTAAKSLKLGKRQEEGAPA